MIISSLFKKSMKKIKRRQLFKVLFMVFLFVDIIVEERCGELDEERGG